MVFESFAYFFSRICLFTNFVNTAQGFPKPLSLEEEKAEFEKMKKGDQKAREKLISHNLRLVAHIVKRYTNSLEADDLLSVGTIGLIKAIDTFDYDKKVQLSTYAARCINNEILMLIRANKKHKNVVSINTLTNSSDDDKEVELKDVLSSDDDEVYVKVEQNLMMQQVRSIIKHQLTEREQLVIKLRYGIDCPKALTQKEVSQKLGISRSYISRIENKTLEIIRLGLGEKGLTGHAGMGNKREDGGLQRDDKDDGNDAGDERRLINCDEGRGRRLAKRGKNSEEGWERSLIKRDLRK